MKREGSFLGVEVVAPVEEPRRRFGLQVGSERHDEHVRIERAGIGLDTFRARVDHADSRLHELHSRLDEVAVGVTDLFRTRPPEHHVEFREPEDKVLALVDQDDIDVGSELVGQPGRQLQSAESRTEHRNSRHPRSWVTTRIRDRSGLRSPRTVHARRRRSFGPKPGRSAPVCPRDVTPITGLVPSPGENP